jgi:hypothetical protein
LLALAADAGTLAALGGQDVGVASAGVAPAQVILHAAGQDGVIAVVRAAMAKVRIGPNCGPTGLAQEALVGVKHNSTLARSAQARMAGVSFADRLPKITWSR